MVHKKGGDQRKPNQIFKGEGRTSVFSLGMMSTKPIYLKKEGD